MTKLLFIDRISSIIPFIKSKKNLYCADCSKKKIITEPENKYSNQAGSRHCMLFTEGEK